MKSLNIPKRGEARTSTNQQASQLANQLTHLMKSYRGCNTGRVAIDRHIQHVVTRRKSAAEHCIRLHLQEHPSIRPIHTNTVVCTKLPEQVLVQCGLKV